MCLTQGPFSAMVADAVLAELRGTVFGICNLFISLGVLVASVLANTLRDGIGLQGPMSPVPPFTTLAMAGLFAIPSWLVRSA